MAVNLSPIGGVAGQFFDNNGDPLSGGKIFTYSAGTTTPQTTYTSASGATPHANPIILDAAGRVPSGEIWLTDGLQYKFVIQTSTNVLIGTYDNIIGINSNFINYTNAQEIQTATAGQTVFTLTTMQYQPATNSLSVFVDGVNQYGPGSTYAYQETSATVVTFSTGLHVGAEVKFTTSAINASSYGDAEQINYTPPFVNSAATNVELKLAQNISVKDFGAIGDGIANDTVAIQNAFAAANNKALYFPAGTYKITSIIVSSLSDATIYGDGFSSIVQVSTPIDAWQFDATCSDINVHSMAFIGASVATEGKIAIEIKSPRTTVQNCYIADFNRGVSITLETANDCSIVGNFFENIVGGTSGNGYAAYTIGQRTTIINNHFVNVGRHDVYLSGSIPQGAQYCVVSNNTSVDCGYEAIALYATATQDAVKGCVVSNNTIKNSTTIGIGLGQNVVDCVISGNYVVGAGDFGVYLNGSTALNTYPSRNTISANVVVDAGIRQINLLNAINNTVVGNSTSAVSVTPATLFGVTVSYAGSPVTFPTGNVVSGTVATGISPVKIDSLNGVFCGINARAEQSEWLTAADGDTSPSVASAKNIVLANTSATTITNFDNGVDGQEITLFFTNGNTTVNRDNAFLNGNVNFVGSANDTLTLIKKDPYWYEKSRSLN